ncbi:hypothetical protein Tco_0008326 [Tanacetum coccineum]
MTELRAPECPYHFLRIPMRPLGRLNLDGTDTESEPFEDPIDTETPASPLAIAPPIPLSESTPPVLVPILRRTARMAVRVPHAMSSGLSAGMAEVAAMSESAFRKRFRSSYESSPSVSSWKSYRGTVLLQRDEDPATEQDEGLTAGSRPNGIDDEGYGLDDKSRGIDDEGYSIESDELSLEEEEEVVPMGQQQAALVVGIIVSAPLRLGYRALRSRIRH